MQIALLAGAAVALAGVKRLDVVNRITPGAHANEPSFGAAISANGRYVAYVSLANPVAPGGTYGYWNVFLRDRSTGKVQRVSVKPGDEPGRISSSPSAFSLAAAPSPAISADGRYVAFSSDASNLIAGDTNGETDIFVRDTVRGTTERVSLPAVAVQANGGSHEPALSADGRYVVFYSLATNMVPGDTNGGPDVFVRDRVRRTTERVSLASSSAEIHGSGGIEGGYLPNLYPTVSADGRYVAFASDAADVVPEDRNRVPDVFVRDRLRGTTERVSVSSVGEEANGRPFPTVIGGGFTPLRPRINADGRYVAFESYADNLVPGDTNALPDIFVRDRVAGQTERVSVASDGAQAEGSSSWAFISPDGRFIAFVSEAANLALGDTNGNHDVFVRDRVLGSTQRVSVSASGAQGDGRSFTPSLSADGQTVAFVSQSDRLVAGDNNLAADVFVRDRARGTTETVSTVPGAATAIGGFGMSLSADGRDVAFVSSSGFAAGDSFSPFVFVVRDRVLGTTERVNVASNGAHSNGDNQSLTLSPDGRYVLFDSRATNLAPGTDGRTHQLYLRDREAQTTELVSVAPDGTPGNFSSDVGAISADGRFIVFSSSASNLVPGDTNGNADLSRGDDVFVRDRAAGSTERVSVSTSGSQGDGQSGNAAISADGRFVAFTSWSTNLVVGHPSSRTDVFVRDRARGTTERVNLSSEGAQANGSTDGFPAISADGRFVAFQSHASNLTPGDTPGSSDIFVRDRRTGQTERVSPGAVGDSVLRGSVKPSISADGRYVSFSYGDGGFLGTRLQDEILVRDRLTGFLERISVAPGGAAPNGENRDAALSADGRFVAFASEATNLVPVDPTIVPGLLVAERWGVAAPARPAVFRPATQEWLLRGPTGAATTVPFGGAGDQPLPAEYFRTGTAQIAVFRAMTREWFLRSDVGATAGPIAFGEPGDRPVPADFLGERRAQVAVFRPSSAEWFIRSGTGSSVGPIPFGRPGDRPVPADYLGLGRVQLAVFRGRGRRPGLFRGTQEWLIRRDNGTATAPIPFGEAGDLPIPGDYEGLGRAQLALFRPSTGEWLLRSDNNQQTRIAFGQPGDIPVPADYLGYGRMQLAVYRPGTGEWLLRAGEGEILPFAWGGPGDEPVPARYALPER